MKRSGPKTEPWGTPVVTVDVLDLKLFNWIHWVCPERYDLNQDRGVPVIPIEANLSRSTSCETVSKATVKSRRTSMVKSPEIRPFFLGWDHLELFEAAFKLYFGHSNSGHHRSPLHGAKSWNVFLKKHNFFTAEERKAWTSWMTRGWVHYLYIFLFWKWNTPLTSSSSSSPARLMLWQKHTLIFHW